MLRQIQKIPLLMSSVIYVTVVTNEKHPTPDATVRPSRLKFGGALFFTLLDLSRSSTRSSVGNCQHQNCRNGNRWLSPNRFRSRPLCQNYQRTTNCRLTPSLE